VTDTRDGLRLTPPVVARNHPRSRLFSFVFDRLNGGWPYMLTMSTGSPRTPPSHLSPPSRAITSTLSARAAPSVPPATQTYEPLARAALRRRLLYDILPPSILPVWISTIFWKTWDVGGMSVLNVLKALIIPFHPSTLFVTIFVWAFGVLPIIVLRKSQLTGESVN